ncbi:Ydc2-catalyt-domain-containing protein [Hypomontagnella monticulosa]|nr:Ydc2-catalyt-domain-containing protein [Hypomontagnella monticulosa]
MSSNLETILPKLKAIQVKQLAMFCGVKSSGTKPELISRLSAVASARQAKPATTDGHSPVVLSVDLGIRNLSYCLMSPASPARPPPLLSSADALRNPRPVHVRKWTVQKLSQDDSSEVDEPFSPASLAIAADRLLREELLPLKPTHILIERQRWRSGGAAAIQQWTVRVNTLEAMLHASLRTRKELVRGSEEEVESVPPDRVARFWLPEMVAIQRPLIERWTGGSLRKRTLEGALGEKAAEKARHKVKGQATSKEQKMKLLESWLERKPGSEVVLPVNPDVEDTVQQFRQLRMDRQLSRKLGLREQSTAEKKVPKLDDLTDSLLQGITWLKWEENQASLLTEEGITMLREKNLLESLDSTLFDM